MFGFEARRIFAEVFGWKDIKYSFEVGSGI